MKVAKFCTKGLVLVLILTLTIIVPKTYANNNTQTGPNTFFLAWTYPVEVYASENGDQQIYSEEWWSFAIRDMDIPTGRASLSDLELFAASYTVYGYRPEEGYFLETIVFGTLEYVEDGGWGHWEPNPEFKVTGGGSFTVRPVTGPDHDDWEKVVFKISAKDSYGSKISISGTYICASGPTVYYVSLTVKLTGQVYKYDFDNDSWIPTGRVETHTLKLRGYVYPGERIGPYGIWAWAFPDQLTWFPEAWPIFWD
jgi:hypothetical protein